MDARLSSHATPKDHRWKGEEEKDHEQNEEEEGKERKELVQRESYNNILPLQSPQFRFHH